MRELRAEKLGELGTMTTTLENATVPRAYAHGLAILRGRVSRKVATETRAARQDDGRITVTYRGTDVVTFHPDGSITLDNGGWPTMTTKRRMDEYLRPLGLSVLGYVLRHGDVPKSAAKNPWRVIGASETVAFQDAGESGVFVANPWSNYYDVSPATGAPGWGSNYGTAPRLVATITPAMVASAPWTMEAIREAMTAAGSHWFDADTLAWFGTELYPWSLRQTPTGALFVTSEYLGFDRDETARGYSVRRFTAEPPDVSTVGDFNGYETRQDAQHAATRLASLENAYTVDVCQDCYCAHAGVIDGPEPTPVPLSLIPETAEVSDGCLVCEPCEHPDCGNATVCDCRYGDRGHGFSRSRCEGCGSTDGGNRYPLVIWPASR